MPKEVTIMSEQARPNPQQNILQAPSSEHSSDMANGMSYREQLLKPRGERQLDVSLEAKGIDPDSLMLDEAARLRRFLGLVAHKPSGEGYQDVTDGKIGTDKLTPTGDIDDLRQQEMAIRRRIMANEAAQNAFATGGEERYQLYIEQQFKGHRLLQRIQQKVRQSYEKPDVGKTGEEEAKPEELPSVQQPLALPSGQPKEHSERLRQRMRTMYYEQLGPGEAQELATVLNNYIKLAAQRERRAVTVGRYSENAISKARFDYENVRQQVKKAILDRLEMAGLSKAELVLVSRLDGESEIRALKTAAIQEAKKLAGLAENPEEERGLRRLRGKFLDLWSSWGGEKLLSRAGITGQVKKGGVMIGLGTVAGFMTGAVTAPIWGSAAGAVVVGGAASGIARGLMGAKLNKAASDRRNAKVTAQVIRRYDEQISIIERTHKNTESFSEDIDRVTDAFHLGTEAEVKRNRRRLGISIGIAALAGAAGGVGGRMLAERLGESLSSDSGIEDIEIDTNGETTPEVGPPTPDTTEESVSPKDSVDGGDKKGDAVNGSEETDTDERELVLEQPFQVEYANGYTHEIIDASKSLNHPVSPEQAWKIHQMLVDKFGPDYIDIEGIDRDTYTTKNGDHRLSAPGRAQWEEGVARRLRELIEESETVDKNV